MNELASCPAQDCDSKVVIWPGDKVNFCCVNCWEIFYRFYLKQEGLEPGEPYPTSHSEQCVDRQAKRQHEPIITDREFVIMGGPVGGTKAR